MDLVLTSAQQDKNENLTYKKKYPATISYKVKVDSTTIHIDGAVFFKFYKKYPKLKTFQSEINTLYKSRKYNSIWYDDEELIEVAKLLYSKENQLEEEGIKSKFAYKDEIDGIFNPKFSKKLSQTDSELMLSSLFVFYAEKVYYGIETEKIQENGWFIPRKNFSYSYLLNSLLENSELLNENEEQLCNQYYKLRDVLK